MARNISSVMRYRLGVNFVNFPPLESAISHSEAVSGPTPAIVSSFLEKEIEMDSPQHDAAFAVVSACPAANYSFSSLAAVTTGSLHPGPRQVVQTSARFPGVLGSRWSQRRGRLLSRVVCPPLSSPRSPGPSRALRTRQAAPASSLPHACGSSTHRYLNSRNTASTVHPFTRFQGRASCN